MEINNYKYFKDSLEKIQLFFDVSLEQIAVTGRTLMLLLCHLYMNLPNLLPKVNNYFNIILLY